VTDIALFKEHFGNFEWVEDDLTGSTENGQNSGLVRVKGFTADTEVLTSSGWLLFPEVKDILLAEKAAWDAFDSFMSSAAELGVEPDEGLLQRLRFSFKPLLVASVSPYKFNEELKERVTGSGEVVFVQPSGFYEWLYNRNIVRVKMRGIDIRVTPSVEFVAKRKFREGYGFVKANDVYENQYEEYFYLFLNRFNRMITETFKPGKAHIMSSDVLAWWDGLLRSTLREAGLRSKSHAAIVTAFRGKAGLDSDGRVTVSGVGPGLEGVVESYLPDSLVPVSVNVEGRGAEVFPKQYATRYSGYRDFVYNVTVPPYGTLIVRKHKPADSERKWIGKPVVVGDASMKSVPVNGGYLTGRVS
jgi:hypothetical protein